MSLRLFQIIFLATAAISPSALSGGNCVKPRNRAIVHDARAVGLLPGRMLSDSSIRSFKLSDHELTEIDCRLNSFLTNNPQLLQKDIENFRFQYYPFSCSGSRFVAIQGLHKSWLAPLPDGSPNPWRQQSLHIDGGGTGVWQVLFEIGSGSFTDFRVNWPE